MYNIHQGGHKRNGSYEGVDSSEPQPPLVVLNMMVDVVENADDYDFEYDDVCEN